jgi:predicted Zn-dependent peptidase
MELRSRETDLRSNQFWLAQLMSYDYQGWDMGGILDYPRWVRGLDGELVRAAARRYLDPANYVQASLLPEPPAGAAGTAGQ